MPFTFLLLFVKEDFHGYRKGIISGIQEIQKDIFLYFLRTVH